jgi:hypothetical protein
MYICSYGKLKENLGPVTKVGGCWKVLNMYLFPDHCGLVLPLFAGRGVSLNM